MKRICIQPRELVIQTMAVLCTGILDDRRVPE